MPPVVYVWLDCVDIDAVESVLKEVAVCVDSSEEEGLRDERAKEVAGD